MLIWGKGEDSSILGELGERHCPVCEKRGPFQAVLQYTYRHIWYLFSWVSGRQYFAVCGNCGNGVPMDKGEVREKFQKDGIPFFRKNGWIFALVLMAAVVGIAMHDNTVKGEQSMAYLASPQAGDIYLANLASIKNSGYESTGALAYGFMKLAHIEGDKLFFVVADTAYTKKKSVRKALDRATDAVYDMEEPLILSEEQARTLYDKGVVYEIRRK